MTTFDQNLARLLLEICRYTYAASFNSSDSTEETKNALDWINQAGVPDSIKMLTDDDDTPTSVACVVSYPDKNIVSYMGTKTEFNNLDEIKESIDDWYENANALLVPFSLTTEQMGLDHPHKDSLGGRVHNGFLHELSAIQTKVIQELMQRGGKDKPVYITGHSQGGAVAALATKALFASEFPIMATYTFAAARPGDLTYSQSIPETIPVYRLEFGDDIVPHLPPSHINKNVQLLIEVALKNPFIPKFAESLLTFLHNTTTKTEFVSVGGLCYGSHDTKELHVEISAKQEASMFYTRLMGLISNPRHWADHHHLDGTTSEVSNGKKGNYTALVSEFELVT